MAADAWDQAQGQFVDLDGDFDSQLRSALRIAKQQGARPIGRAGDGRTIGVYDDATFHYRLYDTGLFGLAPIGSRNRPRRQTGC